MKEEIGSSNFSTLLQVLKKCSFREMEEGEALQRVGKILGFKNKVDNPTTLCRFFNVFENIWGIWRAFDKRTWTIDYHLSCIIDIIEKRVKVLVAGCRNKKVFVEKSECGGAAFLFSFVKSVIGEHDSKGMFYVFLIFEEEREKRKRRKRKKRSEGRKRRKRKRR